jgi:hypothetical protein
MPISTQLRPATRWGAARKSPTTACPRSPSSFPSARSFFLVWHMASIKSVAASPCSSAMTTIYALNVEKSTAQCRGASNERSSTSAFLSRQFTKEPRDYTQLATNKATSVVSARNILRCVYAGIPANKPQRSARYARNAKTATAAGNKCLLCDSLMPQSDLITKKRSMEELQIPIRVVFALPASRRPRSAPTSIAITEPVLSGNAVTRVYSNPRALAAPASYNPYQTNKNALCCARTALIESNALAGARNQLSAAMDALDSYATNV